MVKQASIPSPPLATPVLPEVTIPSPPPVWEPPLLPPLPEQESDRRLPTPGSPLDDYTRDIQQEYEEQQEKGRLSP
jgi:hypothetical protein